MRPALSAPDQERYARHLLLDGLEGEGQERIAAAVVAPSGQGGDRRWEERYLAASGVFGLLLEAHELNDEGLTRELLQLRPGLQLLPGTEPTNPPSSPLSVDGWAQTEEGRGALRAARCLRALLARPGSR